MFDSFLSNLLLNESYRMRRVGLVVAAVLAVAVWRMFFSGEVDFMGNEAVANGGVAVNVAGGERERGVGPAGEPQWAGVFDAAAFYQSDAFHQVPRWLPRPLEVLAVETDEVSLRSDGRQEGAICYVVPLDAVEALHWGRMELHAAGLQEMRGFPQRFAATDGQAYCGLVVEEISPGKSRVVLAYGGNSNEAGCTCPTCQGTNVR